MKYSIEEIDEMRETVKTLYWRSQASQNGVPGITEKIIEERLRTYMANGTTPEELMVASARKDTREYLRSHPDEIMKYVEMIRRINKA